MINDIRARLSGSLGATQTGQSFTNTASTAWYSTNVLDTVGSVPTSGSNPNSNGLQYRDMGEGDDLYVLFTIGTAPSGAAGSSMTCEVTMSTSETDGSGTITVIGTGVIPYASATAGAQFAVRINPTLGSTGARYIGVRYTNNATAWTGTGTIFADIVTDIADSKKFYASGFKVS
jgi:hypothetical protein